MSSVAVFWDRDNTLIKDPGYICDPGQVELLPGAAAALKRLAAAGFENIIITNQSGLARGLFDEAALERVHDRVVALFAEQGARIDAIYFCPFLATSEAKVDKYRKDSELRKPRPGMILQAALERKIELAGSWMVGDAVHDAQAGRAAGCRTILIRRPGAPASVRKGGDVDFLVDSIEQAAATVLKYTRRAGGSPPPPSAPAKREAAPPTAPVKPEPAPPAPAVEPPVELAASAKREPEDVSKPPPTLEPAVELAPNAKRGIEESSEPPATPHRSDEPTPITKQAVEAPIEPPVTLSRPDEPTPELKREPSEPTEPAPVRMRPEPPPPPDVTALLQEILSFLRGVDRRSRAEEFALGKLLGAIAQIIAIGSLTWSIFGLIREEPIETRLGFAILFQLMALTCFVLSPRK
jgi:D,D-heptose 1,7-bisphosphate phosphatase